MLLYLIKIIIIVVIMASKIDNINNNLYNLQILKNRKRGDIYLEDKGLLKKMSFVQKILYFFSKVLNTSFYKDIQCKVKILIDDLVSSIDSENSNDLTSLFFEKLSPLSERIYDRSKINPKILKVFRSILIKSKDYQAFLEKQKACKKNILFINYISEKTKYQNLEKIKNVYLEACLATKLGVRAQRPKLGYSKTYFIKEINGKNIGIFKTAKGDSLSLNAPFPPARWRNRLFSLLGFGGSLFKHIARKCHIAEVASFEIDEFMKTNVVPPTAIVTLNPNCSDRSSSFEEGSFQLFIPNAIEARKFLKVFKNYNHETALSAEDKPDLSDELFDKLVINDIVSGNLDRHAENWLIVADLENPKKAKNIVLIDGGVAFSPTHSSSAFERSNQYLWGKTTFDWAQKRFTQKGKEIIQDVFNRRYQLRDKLIKLYVENGDDEKIANERGDRMLERIEMLENVAIIKNMRKYKLFNYRSPKEIEQLRTTI